MENPEMPFINPGFLERITEEAVGDEFAKLVDQRQYREARVFFKSLPDEQQQYILNEPKYRITMKVLRISAI